VTVPENAPVFEAYLDYRVSVDGGPGSALRSAFIMAPAEE